MRVLRILSVWTVLVSASCGGAASPDSGPNAADAGPSAEASVDAGGSADGGVDGGTCAAEFADFPSPTTGRCTVSVTAEGLLSAGRDAMGGFVTVDGARVSAIGDFTEFGGFPTRVWPVPGGTFVLVSDASVEDQVLRVIDVRTHRVVDEEVFAQGGTAGVERSLFLGLAVSADGRRAWASGGGSNAIWAFDLDPATGTLTAAPSRDLRPPMIGRGYFSGLALSPDGNTLYALALFEGSLLSFDTTTGAERRARIPVIGSPYDLVLTADGETAYVTMWETGGVRPVRLSTGQVLAEIPTGRSPESPALSPDGLWLAVPNADRDSVTILSTTDNSRVQELYEDRAESPRGAIPSTCTFGPDGRLYVVKAGSNAIDVYVRGATSFARQGRIPTTDYPTDVRVQADGTVIILNGKHHGTGAATDPDARGITQRTGGSVQVVPAAMITPSALSAWSLEVDANNGREARFQTVECPAGAPYDFPIPRPGEGPSTKIRRVIVVVRENKTFDAYFGDLPGVRGEPSLTILPAARMDSVLPNTRALARTFAIGDNYYSRAEQSIQGHILTSMGRTTDFVERSWTTTWGRAYWGLPPQGVQDIGYPEEGSVFEWMARENVQFRVFGEIIGASRLPDAIGPDQRYPGGVVYNMGVPDVERGRYLASQFRTRCRMPSVSYALLPNDHTYGLEPGRPTPSAMMADNDEGIGVLVDAVSHSTYWPETLLVFVQDDPQDGGDHIENHRSPLLLVSPWVKRGYVSHVHYDEASVWRTIQLILGLANPLNRDVETAAPLYDLFTSTPDYTPYSLRPRTIPAEVNPPSGTMSREATGWDFSRPDEQEGLSRVLWQHFHGTEAPFAPVFEDDDGR